MKIRLKPGMEYERIMSKEIQCPLAEVSDISNIDQTSEWNMILEHTATASTHVL